MGTAVHGINRIGKSIHRLGVSFCILDRSIDHQPVFNFLFDMYDRMEWIPVAVEVANKRGNPSLKIKTHLAVIALIDQFDLYAAGDKSHFSEALHECLKAVRNLIFEDFAVKSKGGFCAGFFGFDLTVAFNRRLRPAAFVTLVMVFPFTPDFNLTPFRKRIYGRNTDTMQTAGDFIAAAIKFTARVEGGHHQLQGRPLLGRMLGHRNTTAIIHNSHAVIFMDRDLNFITRSSQCFVDRVIDDLVYQVMERFDIRTANIHARTAANRLQTFQHLNVFCFIRY